MKNKQKHKKVPPFIQGLRGGGPGASTQRLSQQRLEEKRQQQRLEKERQQQHLEEERQLEEELSNMQPDAEEEKKELEINKKIDDMVNLYNQDSNSLTNEENTQNINELNDILEETNLKIDLEKFVYEDNSDKLKKVLNEGKKLEDDDTDVNELQLNMMQNEMIIEELNTMKDKIENLIKKIEQIENKGGGKKTKRNKTKRNKTKRNKTKQNKTKRNKHSRG